MILQMPLFQRISKLTQPRATAAKWRARERRANASLNVPSNHTPRVVCYRRFPRDEDAASGSRISGVVRKHIAPIDSEPKAGRQSDSDVRPK
jgi:hypothetical protein